MEIIMKVILLKGWERGKEYGSSKMGQFMKASSKMISKMELGKKPTKQGKFLKVLFLKVINLKECYLIQTETQSS